MSRPATSSKVLEARGAFKKHPDRKRKDVESALEMPSAAPSHLNPLEVKYWHYFKGLVPEAVLSGSDIAGLEMLASLWAEYQHDKQAFPASKLGHIRGLFGSFGLTPSDRAKLGAIAKEEPGEFDDL